MTQQIINVGAAPNDGTGDPLQTAFTKSNANFTELYQGAAPLASPTFTGDPKSVTPTAGDNDTSIATTAFVTTAVAGVPAAIAPAWTAYTPTVTAGAGSFTTVSATGRHLIIGKLTHIRIGITVTTNGTASSFIRVTLPNTVSITAILAGRDNNSGKACTGTANTGTSNVDVVDYNNAYPATSGSIITLTGIYENA